MRYTRAKVPNIKQCLPYAHYYATGTPVTTSAMAFLQLSPHSCHGFDAFGQPGTGGGRVFACSAVCSALRAATAAASSLRER